MTYAIPKKYFSKDFPPISARGIKNIRQFYDLSQSSFAKMLNISVKTLQNYEISRTTPSSTATALFYFAKGNPKLFIKKIKDNPGSFVR